MPSPFYVRDHVILTEFRHMSIAHMWFWGLQNGGRGR